MRAGTAAVEFALVLPLLLTLACGAMDFARVYYHAQVIADCARTGAMFAADPDKADKTDYDDVEQATLAGAAGMSPRPVVAITNRLDGAGKRCIAVNVRYSFPLMTSFIGIPSPVVVSRTAYARLYPAAEDE